MWRNCFIFYQNSQVSSDRSQTDWTHLDSWSTETPMKKPTYPPISATMLINEYDSRVWLTEMLRLKKSFKYPDPDRPGTVSTWEITCPIEMDKYVQGSRHSRACFDPWTWSSKIWVALSNSWSVRHVVTVSLAWPGKKGTKHCKSVDTTLFNLIDFF